MVKFNYLSYLLIAVILSGCEPELLAGGASVGGSGKPGGSHSAVDDADIRDKHITYGATAQDQCGNLKRTMQFVDVAGQPLTTGNLQIAPTTIHVQIALENIGDSAMIEELSDCRSPVKIVNAEGKGLEDTQVLECPLSIQTRTWGAREAQQLKFRALISGKVDTYRVQYQAPVVELKQGSKEGQAIHSCPPLQLEYTISKQTLE